MKDGGQELLLWPGRFRGSRTARAWGRGAGTWRISAGRETRDSHCHRMTHPLLSHGPRAGNGWLAMAETTDARKRIEALRITPASVWHEMGVAGRGFPLL